MPLLDLPAKFSQVLACSQNTRILIKIVSIGRNFVSGVVISFVLFLIRSEQVSVASPIVQAIVSPIVLYRRNLLTTCENKRRKRYLLGKNLLCALFSKVLAARTIIFLAARAARKIRMIFYHSTRKMASCLHKTKKNKVIKLL